MAKSKVEYWNGSAWVEAKTVNPTTGAADNQNALLKLDIQDSLNSPMKADIILSNGSREPFSSGTAADRYGPLTNVFTDFMPIRVLDSETNVVLFAGKVYEVDNTYEREYGQVIKLYARDNLAELADLPIDDKVAEFVLLSGGRRSATLKDMIQDTAATPHRSSFAIPTSNISFTDTQKFTASARTYGDEEKGKLIPKNLAKTGLKAVYEIAKNDPHESSAQAATFGYDFYVDTPFATVAGENPAADFNYFKRGSRVDYQSTVSTFKGPWIEYPIATNFTTTGLKQVMFPDYDFSKPKQDLYTSVVVLVNHVRRDASDNERQDVTQNFPLLFEMLDATSISAQFTWKNKGLTPDVDTGHTTADFAEILRATISGTVRDVGRIQYQSVTSGTGKILITFDPSTAQPTTSLQKKYFDSLSGTTNTLTGATSGATLNYNAVTGRSSTNLGLQRPLKLSGADFPQVDSLRRRVASAFTRSNETPTTGIIRTLPPPYTYVDFTVESVTSNTVIVLDPIVDANGNQTVEDFGLQKGMVIAKVDANGTQTAYGYVTAIATSGGDSTVTTTLNTGGWATPSDYTGTVRIYIPTRASHYIYAKNNLADFAGYMLLQNVTYQESPGAQVTQYKGVGVNATGLPLGLGVEKHPIEVRIESEGGKLPDIYEPPVDSTKWTFEATSDTDTSVFTAVDRDTVSWVGGVFTLGQTKRYKIRASSGTEGDMVTTTDSNTGYPIAYKIVFKPDQDPDASGTYNFELIRTDQYFENRNNIILGHIRAAKHTTGKASVLFDPTGMGLTGGIDPLGEDQLSAALFKKTIQPYTTDIVISAGTNTGSNKHRYVSSTVGTISFADNSAVYLVANTAIDLHPNGNDNDDDTVWYIYFKLIKSDGSETDDFTQVRLPNQTGATVNATTSYAEATTSTAGLASRGLLAIVSTGDVSELDEIAVQAFHGKGQNITADTIAANAIVAGAIKAGTISTKISSDMSTSGAGVTMTTDGKIYSASKAYADNNTGFILDGGTANGRLQIGANNANNLKWDGSALSITGTVASSTITGGTITGTTITVNDDTGADGHFKIVADNTVTTLRLRSLDDRNEISSLAQPLFFICGATGDNKMFSPNESGTIWLGNIVGGSQGVGWKGLVLGTPGNAGTTRIQSSSNNDVNWTLTLPGLASDTDNYVLTADGTSGATEWASTSSSKRYKDNIREMELDTSKIYNLTPKSFDYKEGHVSLLGGTTFGYVAEEVEDIMPEIIQYNKEGQPDSLHYQLLTIHLIEEVKKLKARIEELEG